MMVVGKLWRH